MPQQNDFCEMQCERGMRQKKDKPIDEFVFLFAVEPAGVEPASKQVIYVLSTRLLLYQLSGKNWNSTNLPFP